MRVIGAADEIVVAAMTRAQQRAIVAFVRGSSVSMDHLADPEARAQLVDLLGAMDAIADARPGAQIPGAPPAAMEAAGEAGGGDGCARDHAAAG